MSHHSCPAVKAGPAAVYGGEIVAGGYFTHAGGAGATRLARWSPALGWTPFGSGASAPVHALMSYGGDLVAAGEFGLIDGIPANRIARWNGAGWTALGSGLTWPGRAPSANALAVYQGDLVVSGSFSTAGGQPAWHIARWNGSSWAPLGMGINEDGYGYALAPYSDELFVGGQFVTVGEGLPARSEREHGI